MDSRVVPRPNGRQKCGGDRSHRESKDVGEEERLTVASGDMQHATSNEPGRGRGKDGRDMRPDVGGKASVELKVKVSVSQIIELAW